MYIRPKFSHRVVSVFFFVLLGLYQLAQIPLLFFIFATLLWVGSLAWIDQKSSVWGACLVFIFTFLAMVCNAVFQISDTSNFGLNTFLLISAVIQIALWRINSD